MNIQIYIVINSSLKMTKGKAISQACHGMARMAVFMDKNQSINWENYMKNGEKKIAVRASQTEFDELNKKYENGTNKKPFCFMFFTSLRARGVKEILFRP